MSQTELEADRRRLPGELDLLVVSDEVYEHYVTGENLAHHRSPALPDVGADDHGQLVLKIVEHLRAGGSATPIGKGELLAPLINAAAQRNLRLPGDAAAGRPVKDSDGR